MDVANDDTQKKVLSATPTGEEDEVHIFSADDAKRNVNRKLFEKIEKELEACKVNVS